MSSTENNCTSGQNIHVALVPCELTHALRIMMKLGGMLWSRKRWLVNSNETQQTIRGTSIEYIRTIWIATSCCINNEPQEDTSPSLLRNSIWHIFWSFWAADCTHIHWRLRVLICTATTVALRKNDEFDRLAHCIESMQQVYHEAKTAWSFTDIQCIHRACLVSIKV